MHLLLIHHDRFERHQRLGAALKLTTAEEVIRGASWSLGHCGRRLLNGTPVLHRDRWVAVNRQAQDILQLRFFGPRVEQPVSRIPI